MRQNLKEARERAGLTQCQVAQSCGITEISYQRIEYGTQTPSLKTAFRVAEVLKSTVDELFKS